MDIRKRKLAELAVRVGINVRENENVLVNASIDCAEIARLVVEEAYKAGAKQVIVKYRDELISRLHFLNQSDETLCEIPEYLVLENKYYCDNKFARISIVSPKAGIMDDVDPMKVQRQSIEANKKLSFAQEFVMGNNVPWTIIAAANPIWAKKVFPELEENEAVEKLWDAIYDASRVTMDNDCKADWDVHIKNLEKYFVKLNEYNFKSLLFKNSIGTDLEVGLVKNHLWAGGAEFTLDNHLYAPNIPTEEVFTMPDKYNVNGRVYSTKPLDFQGKLITDFYLDFKDGKVVNYDAKENKESLKALIEFDEGSCYLGEVALISHNTPISMSNILFYNTLFDENASCHLALGRAYPMNIKGGLEMSREELAKNNANLSMTHNDFMFGSADMSVKGVTYEGDIIDIFVNANFVI